MKRSWWMRFSFLIFLTALALFAVAPTLLNFKEGHKYPIKAKINLGLDLQGGLYMILGIDFNRVYRDEITATARKIEYVLKDSGIESTLGKLDDSNPADPQHTIILSNASEEGKARDKIHQAFPGLVRLTDQKDGTLTYALSEVARTKIEEQSVNKSIEVIRNRIDEFGVTEPEITSQGKDRIVVQLPGVKDIERAKELIGKTAKLEFKMVNDDFPPATLVEWVNEAQKAGIDYKKGESFSGYVHNFNQWLVKQKKNIPEGFEVAFEKRLNKLNNEIESKLPYLVENTPRLTGDDLEDARVQVDQQKNEPYVGLDFKSSGAKRFEELTGANIGKRLAVILDGNIYTAPNIQTRIAGGRAQITMGRGNFNQSMKQAADIALVLRAGALPVQLDFLEQRTVGPSLGHDSIQKAKMATLVGCGLVFLFILIYYKISGAIAMTTLVLNALFVVAILVGLEATLTLPGIAGIALTIGMAVDCNIVIFERIREEKRLGMANYKAVEAGFSQAFWTIMDANVTTALAGICLLNFGTGPIRGFAVTLLIGIATTVYCSYFVGKTLYEFYMQKTEGQDLSI